MKLRDFRAQAGRADQARRSDADRKAAAERMRRQTIEQGKQFAMDHINQKVERMVGEGWRTMAGIIYPQWYDAAWVKIHTIYMKVANFAMHFAAWIPVRLPYRLAQIVWRGGTYARVSQGNNEWTVVIKIFRFMRLKYKCDMDVRSGRVSEVQEPPFVQAVSAEKPAA